MNRILVKLLPALVGVVFMTAAWGAGKTEVYKATVGAGGVQRIELQAGSFYFKPNDVIVKVNAPVEITIKKEPDFAQHSIVLHAPEAGVDFDVELSEEAKTIKFTPTKVGKYPFYCNKGLIEKHRAKGMEGILEVTE